LLLAALAPQARFRCAICGFEQNADTKAATIIVGRSHDDALNAARHWQVGTFLAERFMRRWRGECPPPAPDGVLRPMGLNAPAFGPLVGDVKGGQSGPIGSGRPTSAPDHPLGALKPTHMERVSSG
jgi:hypothetical protein